MHVKEGSGHLCGAGQGVHDYCLGIVGQVIFEKKGGTTCDLRIYKSSCPGGIIEPGIPGEDRSATFKMDQKCIKKRD